MKRHIVPVIIAALLVLAIPVTLVSIGFGLPSQFGETFYGEAAVMYRRLHESKRKKIVLIGNSAVAFGSRSDLIESEISGYDVINFGIYGAIGTKAMLDWSLNAIHEGDIVVILPEPYAQTSSLYFSAKDTWRAVDSDFSMLSNLSWDDGKLMIGCFTDYTSEKYQVFQGKKTVSAEGAYSRKAFEDGNGNNRGYMTFERPYNVMGGGYDKANVPVIDPSVYGPGFLDYLNNYAASVKQKGARAYFGFCPVNSLSLGADKQEKADRVYDYLYEHLTFPILGHPAKYFIDYRYFYDNNVHMNSAGAFIFTDLLAEDLKLELDIRHPSFIDLPAPPEIPASETTQGDNVDASMFEYETVQGATETYIRLTGLTEEGKQCVSLTVPSDYDGVPVREFTHAVFAGNETISRIVLPSNIHTLEDGIFNGCTRLAELVFRHDSITGLNAGLDFLFGADNCYIYLKKTVSVVDCAGGWERYLSRIRYY